ncbi:MAG: archease [Chloroflexi bacterium]|nr:archease [Chloroflexota bacterium]
MDAMHAQAGFREVEHTADWALEVWAPDLPELFRQALWGMYALMGLVKPKPASSREIHLEAPDLETLLVDFLTEALFWLDVERWAAAALPDLHVTRMNDQWVIRGRAVGGPVSPGEKEIKAVTYHGLHVQPTDDGYRAVVVFDV